MLNNCEHKMMLKIKIIKFELQMDCEIDLQILMNFFRLISNFNMIMKFN